MTDDEQQLLDLLPFVRACCLGQCEALREPYHELYGDALLGAWRGIRSWRPDGGCSLTTWVARHVRWSCIDGHRKRTDWTAARSRPVSLTALLEVDLVPGAPAESTLPDPESDTDYRWVDSRIALQQELRRTLHPEEAAIVWAHHVDERTLADIAAELGVPRSTVQGRLQHAMKRLRRERTPA